MSEKSPRAAVLFLSFLRLGATAFGGPAMVAYIRELAIRREWVSGEEFAEGVALCQSIPGATAMQSAAFVGLRAAGVRGAIAA
jgi:chromate transporter